ncbi:Gamma-tubulin complex component 3-like [Oopsacas minuta]|uniref:Gamma-tubulin complex component 3-like n=1 Tax=Oopsacas minuta TaxID=111878 RepID=A0AAV7KFJ6_9METZ|nr:Gamma-tubulin complex component 3-like [Oopsacas minuta]
MTLPDFDNFANIHRLVSELIQHTSNSNDTEANDCNIVTVIEYLYNNSQNKSEFYSSFESNVEIPITQDSFSLLNKCESRISRRFHDPKFTYLMHLYNKLGTSAYSDRFFKFLLILSDSSPAIHFIDSYNILDSSLSTSPLSLRPPAAIPTLPLPSIPLSSGLVLSEHPDLTTLDEYTPASYHILEDDLVSDLLDILVGKEGSFICCSLVDNTPSFEVTASPMIPDSLLKICMCIVRLCYSYLHIQLILDKMSGSPSFITYSVLSAIRDNLQEYREYVTLYPEVQTTPYTLRSLLLYLQDPIYCMTRLCSLLESWESTGDTGGALINQVYRATFTGCQKMRRIIRSFLKDLMVPLQSFIHKWVCLGELVEEERRNDFFITTNQDEKVDSWEKKYTISLDSLPEFISQQLARKILIAGKTVSYLRLVCNESSDNFSSTESLFNDFSLSFETVLDGTFENIIEEIYMTQSAHLMRILVCTFMLKIHLKGFQEFFLMERGDFAFSFLTESKYYLDAPVAQIDLQELKQIFSLSLQSTTAKRCPDYVLNQFVVKLLAGSEGEIGWNVINLDYILTKPLDTVFPPSTILAYQSIFKVVMNIRKSEFILSSLWRQLSLYFRRVTEEYDLSQLYFTSHFYVNCMIHFVKKIQFYTSDVFTSHWDEFCKALDDCTDLDLLRTTHTNYLDNLRVGCYLVSPPNTINNVQIKVKYLNILSELNSMCLALFDSIEFAEDMLQTMFQDLELELHAKQLSEKRIGSNDWGTTDSFEQKEIERIEEFMNKMLLTNQTIQLQYTKFNQIVQSFVKHIYKNPILNLRRLAVILNFSGFYRANTFT